MRTLRPWPRGFFRFLASGTVLDHALAGSTRADWHRLFDRRMNVAPHERSLQVAQRRELDVPHGLTVSLQDTVWVGQRHAARKSEVHMSSIGCDVAEHILHLAAEPEPDRNRVHLVD